MSAVVSVRTTYLSIYLVDQNYCYYDCNTVLMASHRDADLRLECLITLLGGPSQGVQFLHIRQMLHAKSGTKDRKSVV